MNGANTLNRFGDEETTDQNKGLRESPLFSKSLRIPDKEKLPSLSANHFFGSLQPKKERRLKPGSFFRQKSELDLKYFFKDPPKYSEVLKDVYLNPESEDSTNHFFDQSNSNVNMSLGKASNETVDGGSKKESSPKENLDQYAQNKNEHIKYCLQPPLFVTIESKVSLLFYLVFYAVNLSCL